MRVRRVASCVMVPPYCTSSVTVAAGRHFFRQGDDGFRQAAGVIDVGGVVVAEPLQRLAIERDAVPRQRRRDLQRHQLLRLGWNRCAA